jgi:predicted transcriptional regulator
MTTKATILESVQGFPDALTFDDAVRRLGKLYGFQPEPARIGREKSTAPGATFVLKKDQILDMMQRLPDHLTGYAAVNEAAYRLDLLFHVEMGLEDAKNGKGVPHEEAMRRFTEWRG